MNLLLASIPLFTPSKLEEDLDPKNIDLLLMPPQLPASITSLLNILNINILIKSLMDGSKYLPLISPLSKQPLQPLPRLPNS
jgi:hypothetical protein